MTEQELLALAVAAIKGHHQCEQYLPDRARCERIGNWSVSSWDSPDSWYCDEHVRKFIDPGSVNRSESLTAFVKAATEMGIL